MNRLVFTLIAFIVSSAQAASIATQGDTLRLSATIEHPTCTFETNIPNDTVNLGRINPGRLSNIPNSTSGILNNIVTQSAFGDLRALYSQQNYAVRLVISCPKSTGALDAGRMSIGFGMVEGTATGVLGISNQGYVFAVDNPSLKNYLGLILFVKDTQASNGQNGLVKPGRPFSLVSNQSFRLLNNSYSAVFHITPGLFWIQNTSSFNNTDFKVDIPIELVYN